MQYGQSVDEDESICGQIPQFLGLQLLLIASSLVCIAYAPALFFAEPSFCWVVDIVLHLCERGNIEGGMIFQLLEDLTEMATMKDCKEIFGYIESKQDILGKVSCQLGIL